MDSSDKIRTGIAAAGLALAVLAFLGITSIDQLRHLGPATPETSTAESHACESIKAAMHPDGGRNFGTADQDAIAATAILGAGREIAYWAPKESNSDIRQAAETIAADYTSWGNAVADRAAAGGRNAVGVSTAAQAADTRALIAEAKIEGPDVVLYERTCNS
ncbi:hypothetical protein [Kitasatospora cineracea]|uniref:hypothetical protein n=1 Tax=Kitasatospora cineracea TaxID=88074 RepID=UPI0037AABD68